MYVIVAGAGKVGVNLTRELLGQGHEVTLIENRRQRYLGVEQLLEHNILYGDASELWVLERAGIERAEMVIARFASSPLAGNTLIDPVTLPAYRALAQRLVESPDSR